VVVDMADSLVVNVVVEAEVEVEESAVVDVVDDVEVMLIGGPGSNVLCFNKHVTFVRISIPSYS
jgi:hypothetical protein